MKGSVLIVLFLLLSGCHSYRAANLDKRQLISGQRYLITLKNQKRLKGRFVAINDSLIDLKRRNGITYIISRSEIESVRQSEFSLLKSILIPVFAIGVPTAIVISQGSFSFKLQD
jgi:hypothetical protein